MPKADGSLTKPELAAGYMVKGPNGARVAVGRRGKHWTWLCFECGQGALETGQPSADHKARGHRCK